MLTLVINLERRPDRLAFMAAQLDGLGLPFVRIDAIDGASAELGPATETLSVPEHACALSHRKAWQHFLETGHERCLVLEDDVILSPALKSFLDDPANAMPGIDVLRLETRFARTRLGPGRRCRLRGFKVHQLYSTHYGAAAYVLTRAFALAAVRDLRDFTDPVDHVMFGAAEACFYPAAAHQLRPALCVQAELVEGVQDASFAQSDLERCRRVRLDVVNPPRVKVRRSTAEKCLREVNRWRRKADAMTATIREFLITRSTWKDIPFAGPGIPVASSACSVPGGQPAAHSALPALRLVATK